MNTTLQGASADVASQYVSETYDPDTGQVSYYLPDGTSVRDGGNDQWLILDGPYQSLMTSGGGSYPADVQAQLDAAQSLTQAQAGATYSQIPGTHFWFVGDQGDLTDVDPYGGNPYLWLQSQNLSPSSPQGQAAIATGFTGESGYNNYLPGDHWDPVYVAYMAALTPGFNLKGWYTALQQAGAHEDFGSKLFEAAVTGAILAPVAAIATTAGGLIAGGAGVSESVTAAIADTTAYTAEDIAAVTAQEAAASLAQSTAQDFAQTALLDQIDANAAAYPPPPPVTEADFAVQTDTAATQAAQQALDEAAAAAQQAAADQAAQDALNAQVAQQAATDAANTSAQQLAEQQAQEQIISPALQQINVDAAAQQAAADQAAQDALNAQLTQQAATDAANTSAQQLAEQQAQEQIISPIGQQIAVAQEVPGAAVTGATVTTVAAAAPSLITAANIAPLATAAVAGAGLISRLVTGTTAVNPLLPAGVPAGSYYVTQPDGSQVLYGSNGLPVAGASVIPGTTPWYKNPIILAAGITGLFVVMASPKEHSSSHSVRVVRERKKHARRH